MNELLKYPFDSSLILRKKKSIKRELETQTKNSEVRIAILGGSTTEEIKNILELFLMDKGIEPSFYESEYNKWYEDSVFDNKELDEFNPQIVYIHTGFVDLYNSYSSYDFSDYEDFYNSFTNKFDKVWAKLIQKYGCSIIQNNFELPFYRIFGNLDFSKEEGITNLVYRLNLFLSDKARAIENLHIQDVNYISAKIGLDKWYDRNFYHLYKVSMSYDCIPELSYNLANMISSPLGKSKKCLVLDLDNTLWGGIIGDDDVDGIQIGHETAIGESFLEFQQYVLNLKKRGIILAVCSKNDLEVAKKGFTHPDSLLKYEDFISFIANWNPKSENIKEIAKQINIGLDSLVFIDDNPMERNLVRELLPDVVVPEVEEANPTSYIKVLEEGKFFEQLVISQDDLKRNKAYEENKKRLSMEQEYDKYEDFLRNLEMKAEILPFQDVYLDRITQLTNKSNQFNLTTKRYTSAEINQIASSSEYITLYGRLKDKFGDNGLVSVIIGKIANNELYIDLWLMSCRVLRRNFEYTMFYELLNRAKEKRLTRIHGFYYKTSKNNMVKDFYKELGFDKTEMDDNSSEWVFDLKTNKCCEENYCIVNK